MVPGFDALGLSERTLQTVHALGWREPTPVQREAIPFLLHGRDVLVEAETGSGKTGAYGLPMVDRVKPPGLQALVLVPTRELAQQVADDLNTYARGSGFLAVPAYGGVPWEPQIAALREGATCAVATPGRLLDFLRLQNLSLKGVRYAVLDEADRMLDLGFIDDVERILGELPVERQIAMCSATFPEPVVRLAWRHLAKPREVRIGDRPAPPETSEHRRLDVASSLKRQALLALLAKDEPRRLLVFCRKRDNVKDLARWLHDRGVAVRALHGDLEQATRAGALAEFADGRAKVLVATDVAARGLDVDDVTHVVNYDLPEDADTYIHRAGRTARAGKSGRVVSIVTEKDHDHLARLLKRAGVRLAPYTLEGFEAPAPVTPNPATTPPKSQRFRRPHKAKKKPGWEKRKGRR